MPPKKQKGEKKGRGRAPSNSGGLLATSLGHSREASPAAEQDTDEEPSDFDIREATPQEGPTLSANDVARLHAKIALLESKLTSTYFDQSGRGSAQKCPIWKYGSQRPLSTDTPTMDKPSSLLPMRRAVLDWLGVHSFVLRLSDEEKKMMDPTELAIYRANRAEFQATWAPSSLTHLHHDVYMELKRHLSRSILVAHIFTQVSPEQHECAARLWDALLVAFHPHSHQVVSAVIAEAASTILQGPDHDISDPTKAFRRWDAAVASLHQNAGDLPTLDAKTLCTCLMIASMYASKQDAYYQAYMHLQATLALPTATLDPHTVRTAAVNAFNAEQRRRSSSAPESVLGFAAAATGFRRPPTGTSTPAASCCRCPHHCVLPDGTFRHVRVEAHIAAVPDRDSEPDVSEHTRRAYRVYKAAITASTSSTADIDRATRALQEERQSDLERARYYRMQEDEEALLAIAAAREYDSDE